MCSLTWDQPAVDDPEIKQLVDSKLDAFWKGLEGGVNKRGEVGRMSRVSFITG